MLLSSYINKDILTYVFNIYIDYIKTGYILKNLDSNVNLIRKPHLNTKEKDSNKVTSVDNNITESLFYDKTGKLPKKVLFIYLDNINIKQITKEFYDDGRIKSLSEKIDEYETIQDFHTDGSKFRETYILLIENKKWEIGFSYFINGNLSYYFNCAKNEPEGIFYFFDWMNGTKSIDWNFGKLKKYERRDFQNKILEINTEDEKMKYNVEFEYKGENIYLCSIEVNIVYKINNLFRENYILIEDDESKSDQKQFFLLKTSYFEEVKHGMEQCYILPGLITCWINYENIINNISKYKLHSEVEYKDGIKVIKEN